MNVPEAWETLFFQYDNAYSEVQNNICIIICYFYVDYTYCNIC